MVDFNFMLNRKHAMGKYNSLIARFRKFEKPCPVKVKGPDRALVEIISDNILDDERIDLTQRLLWSEKFKELLDEIVACKCEVEIYLKGRSMTQEEIRNGFDMVGPVQTQLI